MKNLIRRILKEEIEGITNEQANVKPDVTKNMPSIMKHGTPKSEFVGGTYSAQGVPRAYDALHSFQSRASDGFGGKMNSKIKQAVKDFKNKYGVKNVDIKNVKVYISPETLTVNWNAEITESFDGYSYEEFDSRGSAGGGENAVNGQLDNMKSYHTGMKPVQIYHYNKTIPVCFNSNGTKKPKCSGTINMQQKFFKFGKKVN
jgi:hypothetical protein